MDSSTNNVLALGTRLLRANIAPPQVAQITSTDPTLKDALSELTDLWSTTNSMVRSSRDALYEFLGATYQFSKPIGDNDTLVKDLRASVRAQFTDDKQKQSVSKKHVRELLLAASMGIKQASLRSKYKRILANAEAAQVPPDRESFKGWLERVGGIVSALASAVRALEPSSKTCHATSQSIVSKAADLISRYDLMEKEDRTFDSKHLGFTVVLFYTNPITNKAAQVAVLDDRTIVERAITLAHKDVTHLMELDVAA